jgi:hypothetical protein
MVGLSSCYFCGTALDAPLDEYPVVPPELAGDAATDETVVLCPTCRRKLTAVLEHVTEAVDAAALDADATDDATQAHVPGDAGGTDAATADAATPGADPGDVTPADDAIPSDEAVTPNTDASGEEPPRDPGDDVLSDARTAATAVADDRERIFADDAAEDDAQDADPDSSDGRVFGDDEEQAPEAATEPPIEDVTPAQADAAAESPGAGDAAATTQDARIREAEADADAEGADAATDDAPATDAEASDAEASDAEASDAEASDAEASDAEASDPEASDAASTAPSGSSPDTATYNRVVRLLQNREFPVQTAEIEEVAVNAYDIDPRDFRAVIDAAVERGVLAEEGDQLTVPDQ